jgi:hypothetical protein
MPLYRFFPPFEDRDRPGRWRWRPADGILDPLHFPCAFAADHRSQHPLAICPSFLLPGFVYFAWFAVNIPFCSFRFLLFNVLSESVFYLCFIRG